MTYLASYLAALIESGQPEAIVKQTREREDLYFSKLEERYGKTVTLARAFINRNDSLKQFPDYQCRIVIRARNYVMEKKLAAGYISKVEGKDVRKVEGFMTWPLQKLTESFSTTFNELITAMVKLESEATKIEMTDAVKVWYDEVVKVETQFDRSQLHNEYGAAKDKLQTMIQIQSKTDANSR